MLRSYPPLLILLLLLAVAFVCSGVSGAGSSAIPATYRRVLVVVESSAQPFTTFVQGLESRLL